MNNIVDDISSDVFVAGTYHIIPNTTLDFQDCSLCYCFMTTLLFDDNTNISSLAKVPKDKSHDGPIIFFCNSF